MTSTKEEKRGRQGEGSSIQAVQSGTYTTFHGCLIATKDTIATSLRGRTVTKLGRLYAIVVLREHELKCKEEKTYT